MQYGPMWHVDRICFGHSLFCMSHMAHRMENLLLGARFCVDFAQLRFFAAAPISRARYRRYKFSTFPRCAVWFCEMRLVALPAAGRRVPRDACRPRPPPIRDRDVWICRVYNRSISISAQSHSLTLPLRQWELQSSWLSDLDLIYQHARLSRPLWPAVQA